MKSLSLGRFALVATLWFFAVGLSSGVAATPVSGMMRLTNNGHTTFGEQTLNLGIQDPDFGGAIVVIATIPFGEYRDFAYDFTDETTLWLFANPGEDYESFVLNISGSHLWTTHALYDPAPWLPSGSFDFGTITPAAGATTETEHAALLTAFIAGLMFGWLLLSPLDK